MGQWTTDRMFMHRLPREVNVRICEEDGRGTGRTELLDLRSSRRRNGEPAVVIYDYTGRRGTLG